MISPTGSRQLAEGVLLGRPGEEDGVSAGEASAFLLAMKRHRPRWRWRFYIPRSCCRMPPVRASAETMPSGVSGSARRARPTQKSRRAFISFRRPLIQYLIQTDLNPPATLLWTKLTRSRRPLEAQTGVTALADASGVCCRIARRSRDHARLLRSRPPIDHAMTVARSAHIDRLCCAIVAPCI